MTDPPAHVLVRELLDEVRASIDPGGDPAAVDAMSRAIARMRKVDKALAAEVCARALEVAASSYRGLSALVPVLKDYWPSALLLPSLRAGIHLGVEVGRFDALELWDLVASLGDARDLVERAALHPERMSLAGRQRAASYTAAAAFAGRSLGANALGDQRTFLLEAAIERLLGDRDPEVGARAAWALGVRLVAAPMSRLAILLQPSNVAGVLGRHDRRIRIARVAMALVDESWTGDPIAKVREESNTKDPAARVALLRGLRSAVRLAPGVVAELHLELVRDADADALAVAYATAFMFDDLAERGAIHRALHAEATARALVDAPALALARDDRLYATLLEGALASPREAARAALGIAQALADPGRDEAGGSDEQIAEHLLVESPVLRDALLASPMPLEERRARLDVHATAVKRARARRLRAFEASLVAPADKARTKACAWWLSRVLDASPRQFFDAESAAVVNAEQEALGDDAEAATGLLLRVALDPKADAALDRPVAIALTTAIETGVLTGAITWGEALALALSVPSARIMRDVRIATVDERFGAFLDALASVRAAVRAHAVHPPVALVEASRALARETTSMITSDEEPARRAITALERIVSAFGRAEHAAHAVEAEIEFIDGLLAWQELAASVAERFGAETPKGRDAASTRSIARGLLHSVGLLGPIGEIRGSKAEVFGLKKALREAEAVTPAAFTGLFPTLLRAPPQPNKPKPMYLGLSRPGATIGDYEVVSELSQAGGMGSCYLVKRRIEKSGTRRFVLKLPRREARLDLFRDEVRALVKLDDAPHPGIVRIVNYSSFARPFLVMEHVLGRNLQKLVEKTPLDPWTAARAGRGIASALAHAHRLGLAHFDLKPANVVCLEDDPARPVLVDWGLAGDTPPRSGTLPYMAPERWALRNTYQRAPTDVFALGAILYELVTKRELVGLPITVEDLQGDAAALASITALSPETQIEALSHNAAALASRVERGLAGAPSALVALVQRMIAPNPAARPTAAETEAELAGILDCAAGRERETESPRNG
ncbi:MAG: serine/threonine-protein kinase [Polyangiaceae bacterium]